MAAINFPCSKSWLSVVIAVVIVNYDFNPCGIFEKMTSFSPILNQDLEQGKLMAAVNSRK